MSEKAILAQEDKILAYFERGGTLTPNQAQKMFGAGRFSARIRRLRKRFIAAGRDPDEIKTEMIEVGPRLANGRRRRVGRIGLVCPVIQRKD